jgi:hypothetical protein
MCLLGSELFREHFYRSYRTQLYTGRPPFATLSETASLLRVIDGDRPERPSGELAFSDLLWEHVNEFWAQDSVRRPPTDAVVQRMGPNYVSTHETNLQSNSHDVTNRQPETNPWRNFYKVAPSSTDVASDTDIMEQMKCLVSREDPKVIYRVIKKLGQGCVVHFFCNTV